MRTILTVQFGKRIETVTKRKMMHKKNKKIAFLSHLDANLYNFRLPIMIELVKQGYTVYAVCPRGDNFDRFGQHGVKALEYTIKRSSLNPFKELTTIRNVYKVIKPLKLDILQNFMAKPNIYGSIAGHLAKVPMIINTVTGLGSFYVSRTKKSNSIRIVIEKLYREANKKVDFVIFQNSDDMNYFMGKKLVEQKKALLIKSSGINTQVFSMENIESVKIDALKRDLNIDNKLVVLMVARAIWHKGIREYYEAASLIKKEYDHVTFILIGDTDRGNHSCANTEFLQGGDVLWLGHRDDIKELTALSDIYVLPSYYGEGVPRTLLEAASMSKAIVTTDNVGCREVVDDGQNGFLVTIKDSDALAGAIKKLIRDKHLRTEMGLKSRIKALKEFDVNIVVEKHMSVYENSI